MEDFYEIFSLTIFFAIFFGIFFEIFELKSKRSLYNFVAIFKRMHEESDYMLVFLRVTDSRVK